MRGFRFLFPVLLLVPVSVVPAFSDAGHDDAPVPREDASGPPTGHGDHAAPDETAGIGNGHWSAPAAEKARENPVDLMRSALVEAGEIYRENCAACHGSGGQGDGPLAGELETRPANLFAMAPAHADGDLRWKIAKGRGEMPGWEGVLSDEQIWMLVHYLKTLPAFQVAGNEAER